MLATVAVPPEIVTVKSLTFKAPDPPLVSYTASLNVTAIVELLAAMAVPMIVGAVVSSDGVNHLDRVHERG